jgi:hypothetical protein
MKHRIDNLGAETIFHLVDGCVSPECRETFETRLYTAALGFTRSLQTGGWRGAEEPVYVYRVASLSDDATFNLIRWLLDHTAMQDVYVVHSDGVARGHCLETENPHAGTGDSTMFAEHEIGAAKTRLTRAEHGVIDGVVEPDWQIDLPHFHGQVRKPTAVAAEPLHGVRGTGWPHAAPITPRDYHMVLWAAKALVHERQTGLALGNLPHTNAEIAECIDRLETVHGKPAPSTDEGVKVRSKAV